MQYLRDALNEASELHLDLDGVEFTEFRHSRQL